MVSAIIVAAGQGKRFGANRDKLFYEVAGRPVVAHTWNLLDAHADISELILVVRPELEEAFHEIAACIGTSRPWRLVPGGKERQDSVWNGLQASAPDGEIVIIQDGARPCTDPDVIHRTILAARESGAAVIAQRVTDTLKESRDGLFIDRTVDRSHLWAVQTPQTFRRSIILRALEEVRRRGLQITDDTAACELIGNPVRLVESAIPNPKVTYPGDLAYVEQLLREKNRV